MKTVVSIAAMLSLSAALLAAGCSKSKGETAGAEAVSGAAGEVAPKATAEGTTKPDVPVAPPRGDERRVYSLIDNRLSAHVQRGGGLVMFGGSAGFAKYMRFRRSELPWDLQKERDGKKVAIAGGNAARIDVPLTAEQAAGETLIRARVHNGNTRALSIRINGDQKGEIGLQVEEGWSTVEATAPAGALKAGENEIIFFTGKGDPMAVEWVQIGGKAGGDAQPWYFDAKAQSLILPEGGGLDYYVWIPEKARITGDLPDKGCSVAVRAVAGDGSEAGGTLTGLGSAVELGALAGKAVRLSLTATGCEQAKLASAALVVPGKEPTVPEADPPKHVVLWVMDSLRADRVKIFAESAKAPVPTFEKLAESAAVFTQAYVQGNESRASHASIWSSQYPVSHRMIDGKAKLDEKWTTIDEVAKKANMFTAAVSGNGYVAEKWGFGDQWDVFRNHIHEKKGLKGQDLYDAALAALEPKKAQPWLLYLGTIDTHVSWRPKEPWIRELHPAPYGGRFTKSFSGADAGKFAGGGLKMSDADIEWVRAVYDSNVSYQDELLSQLLAKLDEWGIRDDTMIVITADHGDEMWELGRQGHGQSLTDSVVHVPLLVYYPPLIPGGKIPEGAEVVDILPTIADALGMEQDPEWQGQSLIPLVHGVGALYPRLSMASQYEGSHVGRMGPWKVRIAGTATPQVYDVSVDPAEKKDVFATDSAAIGYRFVADPLWLLRTHNAAWKKRVWGNPANVTAEMPAALGE